jgi:hypothetical protein
MLGVGREIVGAAAAKLLHSGVTAYRRDLSTVSAPCSNIGHANVMRSSKFET